MNYPQFWTQASSRRKRIYLIVLMFIIAVLLTLAGTFVQLSPADAQMIDQQLNQTRASKTLGLDIFENNFGLTLLMFIPIFGAAFGLFVMFSTGIAFSAEFQIQSTNAASTPPPSISLETAIISLAVFGFVFLLEYVSYAIGISESIWLFQRLRKRKWRELKNAGILIGIVAILLTIGAIVETWLITAVG
jgi:hypothetical protein